jgi:hypothetical protein
MTAADVLDHAHAAGVELSTTPKGNLRWRCRGGLPKEVRQALAAHKAELLELLGGEEAKPHGTLAEADADEAEARYRYPPPGTPLSFGDDSGRPCSLSEALWWTWASGPSWFRVRAYLPPPVAVHYRPASATDATA